MSNKISCLKKAQLLDRMAGEAWHQKKRAKMVRYIVRKGFSPNHLGYHGDFSKKGKLLHVPVARPIPQPTPKGTIPNPPNKLGRSRRPKQWPPRTLKFCVSHSREEKTTYLSRVFIWKKDKLCVVMQKLHGQVVGAVQCHHRNGRFGGLLLFESLWIPVSDEGHIWIHENPELAREHGWLCKEEEWNDDSVCHALKSI